VVWQQAGSSMLCTAGLAVEHRKERTYKQWHKHGVCSMQLRVGRVSCPQQPSPVSL
jgi:hypothetical protein